VSASPARPDLSPETRPGSSRSKLGRVALDAAKGLPQVAFGVTGTQKLWATEDRGEILAGVVVTATADARFDVDLHLIARWPFGSLFEVADQVRARVHRAASASKLEAVLGEISVSFEDVFESSEDDQTTPGTRTELAL
jgi:hypothetical protein